MSTNAGQIPGYEITTADDPLDSYGDRVTNQVEIEASRQGAWRFDLADIGRESR